MNKTADQYLITRDKNKEDIFLRTNVFEQAHFSLFNNDVVFNYKILM